MLTKVLSLFFWIDDAWWTAVVITWQLVVHWEPGYSRIGKCMSVWLYTANIVKCPTIDKCLFVTVPDSCPAYGRSTLTAKSSLGLFWWREETRLFVGKLQLFLTYHNGNSYRSSWNFPATFTVAESYFVRFAFDSISDKATVTTCLLYTSPSPRD